MFLIFRELGGRLRQEKAQLQFLLFGPLQLLKSCCFEPVVCGTGRSGVDDSLEQKLALEQLKECTRSQYSSASCLIRSHFSGLSEISPLLEKSFKLFAATGNLKHI